MILACLNDETNQNANGWLNPIHSLKPPVEWVIITKLLLIITVLHIIYEIFNYAYI